MEFFLVEGYFMILKIVEFVLCNMDGKNKNLKNTIIIKWSKVWMEGLFMRIAKSFLLLSSQFGNQFMVLCHHFENQNMSPINILFL